MQLAMSSHAPLIGHLSLSQCSGISHVSVMCWKAHCLPLGEKKKTMAFSNIAHQCKFHNFTLITELLPINAQYKI